MGTLFSEVYDAFLNRITDDMFMEFSELDTWRILQDLLVAAIPCFEFPRQDLSDYELFDTIDSDTYCGAESNYQTVPLIIYGGGQFAATLTQEEINVLAYYMIAGWIDQQLASVELTRMKFSGSDFKFTSQANHLQKLLLLKKDYEREGFHLQRLYSRRLKNDGGTYDSTMTCLASKRSTTDWFSPDVGVPTWR